MASRRLDISSLLCDDSQSTFSPLDVLVHAATEERKRLGALDEPRHPPPFPQPPLPVNNDHHVVRSPVSSPTLSRYTVDDTQRIHPSQQHLYLQRSRTHDNLPLPEQQQQHRKQSSREIDYSSFQPGHLHRVQEPEQHRRRVEEQQRIHELEFQRQQDLERAIHAQEFERRRREEDSLRALEHQQREQERREVERLQQYQQQLFLEEHKQRWEAERQREELRQLERAREAERLREIERQREAAERQQQQRQLEAERLREFDRLREAERIQESKRNHLSQDINELQYPQHFPENHSNNPSPVPHFISHPSPDPLQIRRSATSNSPDSSSASITPSLRDDPRPVKKRRYSESPSRPMPDDQDRIAHERERMLVGELGYGRTDSPVAGTSAAPRRPSTGLNHPRKSVAVADLLADKEPGPSLSLLLPSPPQPRDTHRIISPTGRRSPPGSQVGRAKAARKSDEYLASLKDQLAPPPPKELAHSPIPSDIAKVKEEPNIKQEPKSSHQRLRPVSDEIRTPTVDESRPKKAAIKEAPPLPPPLPPPPTKISPLPPRIKLQDDAHEWFLHQYDEDPSPLPLSRPEPSPMPSSSSLPNTITHAPKSPSTSQKALTPITAAVALEQELEDLVSTPAPSAPTLKVTKQEESDDMDLAVDLAVTELVETMENDDRKHVGMEVDVEDELLSLVDDCPPPPPQPTHLASSARRATAPSLSASGSHAHGPTGVVKPPPAPQPIHRSLSDQLQPPPPTASQGSAAVVPSGGLVARQTSARAMSDRDSMPPPTTTAKGGSTKKGAERADSVVPPEPTPTKSTTGKKKKEVTAKASNAKSKSNSGTGASAKPKGKPSTKSKKAIAEASSIAGAGSATPPMVSKPTKGATSAKKTGSTSGSRSASVVPGSSGGTPVGDVDVVKPEKQEEEEEDVVDNDDDKLYCLCKTKYDENRFMIACDRCDEWYHTQCVKMPDLDVDLVDQFICPSCIEKNPLLSLQTTYKQRCLYGLRHPDADSLKACHKAARGAFSKYCSDECGVKYMQSRIDTWAQKGGKTEKLWDSVKHAEKREGVVICAADAVVKMDEEGESGAGTKRTTLTTVKPNVVRPSMTKVERETERLNILLASIEKMREDIQRGVEIIVCRERLLQLASERAELVGQCGWDQRLCCDDEELADIGAGMLESYEDAKVEDGAGDDADMEVDGGIDQWWCPGKKVCERHAGWQTIRYKDVCKEKEMKEEVLSKLTTREREIRKHMEEMLDPHGVNDMKKNKNNGPNVPLKSSTAKLVNGHHAKSKTSSGEKKGKKRKAPSA